MPLSLSQLYPQLRPWFFRLDPETAHHLSIQFLKWGLGPHHVTRVDPKLITRLTTHAGKLEFQNPVGLAAGYDKNAEVIQAVLNFGFGFIECGSITPLPQPGNPRPRLFRVPEVEGVINRFGFNSDGIEACYQRIAAYRAKRDPLKGEVLGINVGKNKENPDAASDYVTGVKAFASVADYLTVNISSPNTPGLRDLQRREPLYNLMSQVMRARNSVSKNTPLFVKVAPDLCQEQIEDISEVVISLKVDGIIIGNTTIMRPHSVPKSIGLQSGGLSGKPLLPITLPILSNFYRLTKGTVPLIGCGGISDGKEAYAMIKAGATLIQIYTALIYQGPGIVYKINRELIDLLRQDGYQSISEAVGKSHANFS